MLYTLVPGKKRFAPKLFGLFPFRWKPRVISFAVMFDFSCKSELEGRQEETSLNRLFGISLSTGDYVEICWAHSAWQSGITLYLVNERKLSHLPVRPIKTLCNIFLNRGYIISLNLDRLFAGAVVYHRGSGMMVGNDFVPIQKKPLWGRMLNPRLRSAGHKERVTLTINRL